MMKKLLATLFEGAILFSLAACGGEKNQPEKKVSSIGEAGRQPAIVITGKGCGPIDKATARYILAIPAGNSTTIVEGSD
jgi:hypothetical protein